MGRLQDFEPGQSASDYRLGDCRIALADSMCHVQMLVFTFSALAFWLSNLILLGWFSLRGCARKKKTLRFFGLQKYVLF